MSEDEIAKLADEIVSVFYDAVLPKSGVAWRALTLTIQPPLPGASYPEDFGRLHMDLPRDGMVVYIQALLRQRFGGGR